MRTFTLDNGLKILIQEEHTAPLASVWCWYKVGSKDEPPGLTGISHWVEHMNFKGTTNIPRDEVKGIIEQFGGSWNGYTWIDQTTYLETATRDALDRMLFIESERMANCLYHPDDCESERTVIISELQGGENDPDQLLDQEVTAAAFKAHPYQHPTIGWLPDLQAMTREDLYDYYRKYYVPNNATLVIVGDVETSAALGRVEHHFGRIPSVSVPSRRRTLEPEQTGERRVTIRREGTTAYLKVAYHAPAVGDPDFFPLLVVDAVLTGAKGLNLWSSFRVPPPQRSARLYKALVERGLASNVSAALLPTEQPFVYTLSVTATVGTSLGTIESALLEELERLRLHGIDARELAKAQAQLRARLVFDSDSVTNIAHQLGYFETIASVDLFTTAQTRIASVGLADVAAACARMFTSANRTIGWFDPS
ncbi:MAG TPA: pitrilysin family protein [Vicinamibacterales bacterium]|nr:pitrilysin family protein [Vicinamibacterales bacterium]